MASGKRARADGGPVFMLRKGVELPTPLQFLVLEYADFSTLAALSVTCRGVRQTVHNYLRRARVLSVADSPRDLPLPPILLATCRSLQTLVVRDCGRRQLASIEQLIQANRDHFRGLARVPYQDGSGSVLAPPLTAGLLRQLARCPRLERLQFRHDWHGVRPDPADWKALVEHCTELRHLAYERGEYAPHIDAFAGRPLETLVCDDETDRILALLRHPSSRRLSSVSIDYASPSSLPRSLEQLRETLEPLPNLTELSASLNDDAWVAANGPVPAWRLPRLTRLRWESPYPVPELVAPNLESLHYERTGEAQPRLPESVLRLPLRWLRLRCRWSASLALFADRPALTTLRELDFQGVAPPSAVALVATMRGLRRLRFVTTSTRLQPADVFEMLRRLPNLEEAQATEYVSRTTVLAPPGLGAGTWAGECVAELPRCRRLVLDALSLADAGKLRLPALETLALCRDAAGLGPLLRCAPRLRTLKICCSQPRKGWTTHLGLGQAQGPDQGLDATPPHASLERLVLERVPSSLVARLASLWGAHLDRLELHDCVDRQPTLDYGSLPVLFPALRVLRWQSGQHRWRPEAIRRIAMAPALGVLALAPNHGLGRLAALLRQERPSLALSLHPYLHSSI